MKKYRIVIAAILTGIMVLSMTGCGGDGGEQSTSRLASEEVVRYAQEQGAKVYTDRDEFVSTLLNPEHGSEAKQLDGVITLDKSDLKALCKGEDLKSAFDFTLDEDSAMTRASYYYIDGWQDWGAWTFGALSIDFNSAEAAAAYGEKLQEEMKTTFLEDDSDNTRVDVFDGTEDDIKRVTAVAAYKTVATIHEGVYIDGNTVLALRGYENNSDSSDSTLAAFCKAFDIYDLTVDQAPEEEFYVQEYSGNTQVYIVDTLDSYHTTLDGSEVIVTTYTYPDDPEVRAFVDYEATDVYKPSVMYIYLDGVEVQQDEITERTWGYQGRLYLEKDQMIEGVHTMEFVQYKDNDPSQEEIFHGSAQFTLVDEVNKD